jgi:UDP-3-O-[3-hydroxymyristoyl] glucosamine N-acyltransferase
MTNSFSITALTLLESCGDTAIKLHGDPSATATCVRSLKQACSNALLFNNIPNSDLSDAISAIEKGIIIARSPIADIDFTQTGIAILEVKNARLAFARCVSAHFKGNLNTMNIHPSAIIDPSAIVDKTAIIGANSFVGANCTVGARSIIAPNVTIFHGSIIGADVSINAGTVIGADGFGYEKNDQGGYEKFPHLGGVIIEDSVEIGSNTCIDRAALDNTIIKRGARIDNLVHIAHNVVVGEDSIIIALTMVGGSVVIGDRAWVAPSATIINQKSIGSDSVIGLAAVVTKDVPAGQTVMGSPAIDQAQFKKMNNVLKDLVK